MNYPKFYQYARLSGLIKKEILDNQLRESYDYVVKQKKIPPNTPAEPLFQSLPPQNKTQPTEFQQNNVRLRYGKLSAIRQVKKSVDVEAVSANDSAKAIDDLSAAVDGETASKNETQMTEIDRRLAESLVNLGILNRWQTTQLWEGRTKFTLGNYLILNAIGKGGYGHVFLGREYNIDANNIDAKNIDTNNIDAKKNKIQLLELLPSDHVNYKPPVALKVLPLAKSTAELSERFRKEITLQKRLRHPNLVNFIDSGHDGNVDFMVHEFIDGGDVKTLLQQEEVIPYDVASAIIVDLAKCVQYLHDCGIIHRDIKPANILISGNGVAKLIDLGLSVEYDCNRAKNNNAAQFKEGNHLESEVDRMNVGKVAGTIDYVSPDQIREPREPLPSWDIYSIGCLFYQLLTGKVPFPKGDLKQKLLSHLNLEPVDPRVYNQFIPFHIVEIVLAMLAKDPQKRIQTAQEIVERLTSWLPPDGLRNQLI
ncbi:MAG: serine/threonine protein kinase [Planctomycetaceae bacterium]|jgi:serine/threonine protein kinase|nr:serine/threonine protein kinase [Planctomycetaceae bacterium]